MRVEWTDELLTGVSSIDDQHKELFRRTNSLFDAIVKGHSSEEVGKLVMFLESYTVKHFAEEEALRMAEWLNKHLKGADRLIGQFLKGKL